MRFYGVTDIGKSRKENQDRIYFPKEESQVKYFIVADGMGGVKGGELAASIAVDTIKKHIDENISKIELKKESIRMLLKEAICKANKLILEKAEKTKGVKGMGTTIIVVLINGDRAYIEHVGDSRVYRIRKNIIRQLTKDHSYVQALLDEKTITKKEALNHPRRNVLLKVVGCEEEVEPDFTVKGFIEDDVLLMCTDGLTNMVSTREIYNMIVEGKASIKETCIKLIDKANEYGGYDNISAILIAKD